MKMAIPKSKKKAAIYVDGECEQWYFQMMKRNENTFNIDLQPKLPRKKKISEIYEEVKKSSNDYDLVVWVVDLDKVLEEERAKKKGGKSPKEEFKKIYKDLLKVENVKVIVSNPCLEYWLFLHFNFSAKPFGGCSEANTLLKRHLQDYEKTEKYYIKNDLYKRLKENQITAIKNAKKLGDFNVDNFDSSICEMYKLFDPDDKINVFSALK